MLLSWWLIWSFVTAWLLFHGHSVDDETVSPRAGAPDLDGAGHMMGCGDAPGCIDGGSLEGILGSIVLLTVLAVALWLLFELAIPAIAGLLLLSIGGMLSKTVNDVRGCQGRFFISFLWGAIWATVYFAPVAGIILAVAATRR